MEPGSETPLNKNQPLRALEWLLSTLSGVGQIIFQENPWSGLLFLIGVATGSFYTTNAITMAVAGAIGSLLGAALAKVAGRPPEENRIGLHGFNPALVGMVVFAWFPLSFGTFLTFLVGACLAFALTQLIRLTPIPGYTVPFILISWFLHLIAKIQGWEYLPGVSEPKNLLVSDAILEGFSEIMLIGGGRWPGVFFLAGILVGNKWHGILAIIASLAGLLFALHDGDPVSSVNLGLYGYNAVLAAIAMGLIGKGIYGPLCGALLSVILVEWWSRVPLPALTAPFVISIWILLLLGNSLNWVERKWNSNPF